MRESARATVRVGVGASAGLAAAYATNFGALAASAPFLAIYLVAVGFSPEAAAELLALMLLVRVVAIPCWTLLADRGGSIGAVLRLVSAGALVAFAALLFHPRPVVVAAALVAFAAFRAPFGALLDALMLHDARRAGRVFGGVRAWGTAGYALVAVATGALVARDGSRAVLTVTTALLGAALAAGFFVGSRVAPVELPMGQEAAPREDEGDAWKLLASLLRRPRVVLLFAVALLSEIGLAPYDALFPAYLAKLGGATAAGVAVAVGAGAEFLFLLAGARLARKLGPERLLVIACLISTVRWAAMASLSSAAALVTLQVAHAASFGAFYMSAVILVDRETPPSLRASGQGLFGSFSFGVAAAIGLSLAGVVERRGGMPAVFVVATAASLLATGLARALVWVRPKA